MNNKGLCVEFFFFSPSSRSPSLSCAREVPVLISCNGEAARSSQRMEFLCARELKVEWQSLQCSLSRIGDESDRIQSQRGLTCCHNKATHLTDSLNNSSPRIIETKGPSHHLFWNQLQGSLFTSLSTVPLLILWFEKGSFVP